MDERSAGHRLGLRVGDLITKVNGQQLWLSSSIPRSDKPPKLEYYSISSGKMKSGTMPDAPPGIEFVNHYEPELAYLQSKSQNPKWDLDVYAGIVSRDSDPELAETAWFHAIQKGYQPDIHTTAAGLTIALNQGRTEEADLYSRFPTIEDRKVSVMHPISKYRAAAANYRLNQMLALTEEYPYLFSSNSTIRSLIDMHLKLPQEPDDHLTPREFAKKLERDDLLPRLEAYRHVGIRNYLPGLQRGEKVTIQAPPARFQEVMLKTPEPAFNVEVLMDFTWQPERGDHSGFLSQLELQLQTGQIVFTTDDNILPLGPSLLGWSRFEAGEGISFSDASLIYPARSITDFPEPKIRKLRMVCVNGQGELFLDEQRILFIPVAQHAVPIWLYIKVVGSRLVIHDFKFNELAEDHTLK